MKLEEEEELPCEVVPKLKLEDGEGHKVNDLNSSMVLTYRPPADPLLSPIRDPQYYIIYKLQPKLGFSSHDHQSMSVFGATSLKCQYHTKLEGIHNQDIYIML